MKTKILFLLFSFTLITGSIFSQINGVELDKALPVKGNELDLLLQQNLTDDLLLSYNTDNGIMIFYTYPTTTVGLKHCIEKVIQILNDNYVKFEDTFINDELLPDYVDNIFDYSSLRTALRAQSAEVKKMWKLSNGWIIGLSLTDSFSIYFFDPDKLK